MRIRKRQVPFPLSDPNLINRSPVVVQLNDATTTSPKQPFATAPPIIPLSDPPQPSDQHHLLPPIGKPTDGCDDSSGGAHGRHHKKQQCLVVEDGRGQEGGGGQKGNDTRKGGILSSEMPSEVFPPSSPSSSKQDWRWCEGEKAFPLKKRRGMSFENAKIENNNNDSNDNDSKKKMKSRQSRMKAKMNKKYCYDSNEGEEDDNKEEETKPDVNGGGGKNKKVRGGALMEGSRCSRVNGRGWRCCQPTLVGYSLCEHHLGKGRLRSMTSVRSRSAPKNNNNNNNPQEQHMPTNCDGNGKDNGIDIEEEKKVKPVVVTTKKRMKLGMVKARSMSSLLGQTNTDIAVPENNNK